MSRGFDTLMKIYLTYNDQLSFFIVQPQSMETGVHGLVTVDVTLLVEEETNKEHVFV